MYQIVIQRNENEVPRSMLRRFSREAKSSGLVRKIRKNRFESRKMSSNVRRKQKLHSLKKTAERALLIRLGKIHEAQPYNGR